MTATPVDPNSASEAKVFLEALFAGKPDQLHVLLWTLPEKRSSWFKDVESTIQYAESMGEHDLYVGVGFSRQDYGPSRRCPSNEVAGIVGLWADLDLKSDVHKKESLPATIEDALKILPGQFPPTFVVRTGNGAHAWWLLRESLIFATGEERQDAATVVCRWQTLLRLNAAAHGWAFDRLYDLARILRIPGTQNCKDPQNPKPVSIYSRSDRRYNLSDFTEFLDAHAVPDTETEERATQAWNEKLNKPVSINPNATVPEELLNQLMAATSRFKKTWVRQRDGMKDQSQSGYDLALANLGAEEGLSEQQTVDLIIHHRRIHGKSQRTRLDYFQRTLSKASNRAGSNGESGQPQHLAKPDSATARALLCEQISNAIGVRVLRIVKIDGQEPTYRVELETAKIGFASVDKLVGQQSFRMKIASAAEHLVPRIPGKAWDRVAQMMLNALTVEDGGDEADLVGAARMYVERYLSETPSIDAEEEQSYQALFKPTVYEGQIAIRSHDLQQHINKTWGENRAIKEVTAMLSALGASSTRLKRTRLRDQSRWLLPSNEFPPEGQVGTSGETDANPA